MLKPYELLENILLDIENGLKEGISSQNLAEKYELSNGHLSRLFRFAFKQSIGEYIRSRKLMACLDDLLNMDLNVLDIALEYDFEHETSFIRAFKREFGITPGEMRRKGEIVKVKPPLHLFSENKLGDSLLFGPDIVMVPQFYIVGKRHQLNNDDEFFKTGQKVGKDFMDKERLAIKNAINPKIFIGLSKNNETGLIDYLTSVQVSNLKNIPSGYCADTFEASLCAKFRNIEMQYSCFENIQCVINSIFGAIQKFSYDMNVKYAMLSNTTSFMKVNLSQSNGKYIQIELFVPIKKI